MRQYRAGVVDLLGLGIMCGVHEHVCHSVYKPSRSCLLPFCASPIFHFLIQRIFHLLVSSLFVVSNDSGVHSVV